MVLARKPESGLAARVLPGPLYIALRHVFSKGASRCVLVGGTALSGYYAGHRRSDDLDLFTDDALSQRSTVLAVSSLGGIGTAFTDQRSSANFYHASCHLNGHDFTVQVVLDPRLFEVGSGVEADDGVTVASLPTILKMKAATLVSRAAEKDLYDLTWLLEQDPGLDVPVLIALGSEIDGGMNAEAVLISLVGTELRESACDFSLSEAPGDVFTRVVRLRNALVQGLEAFLRGQPAPAIAALVRKLQ